MSTTSHYGFWDELRGTARSRVGGWKVGGGVSVHGMSLFEELMSGDYSWAQLVSLSVCGRLPKREEADLIEVIWMCGAFPDPRIWCNQISALAGSFRCTPLAGTLMGTLASEALRYGPLSSYHSSVFMVETLKRVKAGEDLITLVESLPRSEFGAPQVPGFVRPIAKGDGRVPAMAGVMERKGIKAGEYLTMATQIDRYLESKYDERINAGGFFSAVLLDLGYSPKESQQLQAVMMVAGATACYSDNMARPAGSFMPLRCEDIDYKGKACRSLP